MAFVSRMCF